MRISTFLILLVLTINSTAQLGAHFADSNAVWKTNHVWLPPSPFGYNGYSESTISGDTMINNLSYIKIHETAYDVFCTDIITGGPNYIGALREDTIQNKILFIPEGNEVETILYDYNLQVGDTLPLGYNIITDDIFVSSIDTIETYGTLRMRWRLSAQYLGQFADIIEGIGSTNGLTHPIYVFEAYSFLRCYEQDDTLVYLMEGLNCVMPTDSCFYLGIAEGETLDISYFPNPVTASFTVNFTKNFPGEYTLEIYNQFGAYQKGLQLSGGIETVNIEDLNSGIYFLVLRDEFSILDKQKIIKK